MKLRIRGNSIRLRLSRRGCAIARTGNAEDTVEFVPAQTGRWHRSGAHLYDAKTLRILVEKNFACLIERADEDETDAFPNPRPVATGREI